MLWWLACASQRPVAQVAVVQVPGVQVTVLDGVTGRPRGGVEVVLHDVGETGTCRQALRTDAAGQAFASLCADAPYVVEVSRGLVVWPEVTGASSAGVPSIVVWDVPEADGLYIVGEGQVLPLLPMIDVEHVSPTRMGSELAVPAVVPNRMPVLGANQALMARGDAWPAAYPLVRLEGPVPLKQGGPLQEWFGLGMGLDGVDRSVSPSAGALKGIPGASVWVRERLGPGRYALWDGKSDRARMVEVVD